MVSNELKQMIWQSVAAIPKGKVATYGQIARQCGHPRHARYVGAVLKQLPQNSLIPWHRVVNAKGKISFPIGSDAYHRQQTRLQGEAVTLSNDKINLKHFGWDGFVSES
ncbi:MGMT family protein [Methylophaga sp.]|uniref:MGMT family protein n=1 Tax=Methylophaga sp. TaxID=2024840 RepID=UPI003F6A503C